VIFLSDEGLEGIGSDILVHGLYLLLVEVTWLLRGNSGEIGDHAS
jgi:hypothetical protein